MEDQPAGPPAAPSNRSSRGVCAAVTRAPPAALWRAAPRPATPSLARPKAGGPAHLTSDMPAGLGLSRCASRRIAFS